MMPRIDVNGLGFWYDRKRRRWIGIVNHSVDAAASPRRYRTTAAEVVSVLAGASPASETGRDRLIPFVCSRAFVRVRFIPRRGTLGWQFFGDPDGALRTLRRFARRYELGPAVVVAFTDFSTGYSRTTTLANLLGTTQPES
jgi:hypothetical protein